MEFEEIVRKRYATKLFDGRKIPESKLNELLEIIRMAPSSFNIQPWVIKIVSDKETKEKLLEASWRQPQVTTCSYLLVFCANKNIRESIDKLEKLMLESGADAGQIRPYIKMMVDFEKSLSDEQKLSWAQRQTYLALGNAVNGAKALGFDSCPMEGFDPEAYSRILKLPDYLVPTALCTIGYAIDKPKQKLRFSKEEIFI